MDRFGECAERPGLPRHLMHCCCSLLVLSMLMTLATSSCQKHIDGSPRAERGSLASASAVTVRAGTAADDGQWLMAGKDYENTRFSSLDEISASNVHQLHLAWTHTTGVERGHEAAPLVVGGTLFVVTPYPN